MLGTSVYDLEQKKLVGTVEPLCRHDDCRKLAFSPFAPGQHFLWKRGVPVVLDAKSLQDRLRESLVDSGARSFAERGPLSFQSWSPMPAGLEAPVNAKAPAEAEEPDRMRFPPVSCEPLVREITGKKSALPNWTEIRPIGGSMTQFPTPTSTSDDLPTYEYLQEHICSSADLSFVLDGMEKVAEGRLTAGEILNFSQEPMLFRTP
jgi:hypothetical protein